MNHTITKSVRTAAPKARRIEGIPPDTHPYSKLSFVKRHWDGRSKTYIVTDWLDVPLEEHGAGNITGYRLTAELMAWAKDHPECSSHSLRAVLDAAKAILAQPHTRGEHCKRGAAVTVVTALMSGVNFAVTHMDWVYYCERQIAGIQKYQAWRSEQDAIERVQFVERMKAARAVKRAARLAVEGGAA